MEDYRRTGEEFERKAEKVLKSWGLFGDKYETASEHLEKAANAYKFAKDWSKAGDLYDRLAECYRKADYSREWATAKTSAAECFVSASCHAKAIDRYREAVASVELSSSSGSGYSSAGDIYWNIARAYLALTPDPDVPSAMSNYDVAAQRYDSSGRTSKANKCRLEIARLAAIASDYGMAIDVYERVAREAIPDPLLKYSARKHLFNAAICRFCRADPHADFIQAYSDLDPSFSRSQEFSLLTQIALAVDEPDSDKAASMLCAAATSVTFDSLFSTLFKRLEESITSGVSPLNDEEDLT